MQLFVHTAHVGFARLDATWAFTNRISPFWRLYHDWDPGAAIEGMSGRIQLGPGNIVLVPVGWMFTAVPPPQPVRHLFIHFTLPNPDARLPAAPRILPADARLRAMLGSGAEADWQPSDILRASALVYQTLAMILPATADPDERIADRLTRHIHENLHGRLSVGRLASMTGYTTDHYIRLFAQHLGLTPARYLARERLTLARHLLSTSDLPLDAIAERCGYASRRHLATAFKRADGMTPSAFRATRPAAGGCRSETP